MNRLEIQANEGHPRESTIEMNAERLPAVMAGTYLMACERQARLRDQASGERLARMARAARAPSRRLTNGLGIVVQLAGVAATGGTNR